MELLNKLNTMSSLESTFKKMDELTVKEKYPVSVIEQITTKYGDRVAVQFDDGTTVCLPQRFGDKALDYLALNDIKPLFFVYLGSKDCGKAKPAHIFRFDNEL